MKKLTGAVIAIFVMTGAFFIVVRPAQAESTFVSKDNGEVLLAKDADHDGSYYAAGQDITIDGTINGDLYCVGQSLRVTGTVTGDVICAAQKVTITGTVGHGVRVAAQTIMLSGQVGGAVTAFGQDIELAKDLTVAGDVNGAGQNFTIDGTVTRDVAVAVQNLTIAGSVKGSVRADVERLALSSSPAVAGNLEYTSRGEQTVPRGAVAGTVKFDRAPSRHDDRASRIAMGVTGALTGLITLVVTTVVLTLLLPRFFERSYGIVRAKLGLTVLVGLGIVLGAPVLALMLLLTGFGAPLALIVILALVLLYLLALPFAGYYLARMLFNGVVHNAVLLALAGSALLGIMLLVPLVNILVFMAASLGGVGGVVVTLTQGYKSPNYTVATPTKRKK